MTHHMHCVEILHKILDNIAYTKESNDVTLFQLYPLNDTPMVQPILRLFKNHLMGLFLWLKLLTTCGTQLRTRSVDKWNAFVPEKIYTFNQSRINRKTTIELSVNPVNAEEVKQRNNLPRLRNCFWMTNFERNVSHIVIIKTLLLTIWWGTVR